MSVANPREAPEYELNPLEIQVRKADGISRVRTSFRTRTDAFEQLPSSLVMFHGYYVL